MANAQAEEQADDAIKVAPDLHEVIFENDQVRVIRVTVKPGDTAKMHWHPENLNYILSSGKLRFTRSDGSRADITLDEGKVTFSPAGSHEVENIGASEVQTIQVELKRSGLTY